MKKELGNSPDNKVRQPHRTDLTRVKRIYKARAAGSEAAAKEEAAVAAEILGTAVNAFEHCQHGQRPFEAAAFVSAAFSGAIAGLAMERDRKVPPANKYSPMHCGAAMFRDIWKLREVIDELDVPYDFYIPHAFEFLRSRIGSRLPRPNRLMAPDVVEYVLACWSAYQARKGEVEGDLPGADETLE